MHITMVINLMISFWNQRHHSTNTGFQYRSKLTCVFFPTISTSVCGIITYLLTIFCALVSSLCLSMTLTISCSSAFVRTIDLAFITFLANIKYLTTTSAYFLFTIQYIKISLKKMKLTKIKSSFQKIIFRLFFHQNLFKGGITIHYGKNISEN